MFFLFCFSDFLFSDFVFFVFVLRGASRVADERGSIRFRVSGV